MFRHLIRWGAAALLVLSVTAQPARALPLGGAEDGFTLSLAEIWEHLIDSFLEIRESSGGVCDPNGICRGGDGDTLHGGGDSSGTCDPNGGGCS